MNQDKTANTHKRKPSPCAARVARRALIAAAVALAARDAEWIAEDIDLAIALAGQIIADTRAGQRQLVDDLAAEHQADIIAARYQS